MKIVIIRSPALLAPLLRRVPWPGMRRFFGIRKSGK